jgi:hypothetical protein
LFGRRRCVPAAVRPSQRAIVGTGYLPFQPAVHGVSARHPTAPDSPTSAHRPRTSRGRTGSRLRCDKETNRRSPIRGRETPSSSASRRPAADACRCEPRRPLHSRSRTTTTQCRTRCPARPYRRGRGGRNSRTRFSHCTREPGESCTREGSARLAVLRIESSHAPRPSPADRAL